MTAQAHACCPPSEAAVGIQAMPGMSSTEAVVELSCGHQARVGLEDQACGTRQTCGRAAPRNGGLVEAAFLPAVPGSEDGVWAAVVVSPLQTQAAEVGWRRRGYAKGLRALPIAVLTNNLRI